jgi:TetR/AcrR family transcriptional regulator, transcriptional repressor for nem operon
MPAMSDKRAELEQLASDCVQRSGLRELSFRTLAERVGIKSSSVHYYFPEKGDLTAVLIGNYTEQFIQRLHAISASGLTPSRQLMAFVDLFEEAARDDKLCLCGMLAAELASLDDTSRALLQQFFKRSEDWLRALLARHPGPLAVGLPPARLAAILMSGLEGALLLDRVHGQAGHLKGQRQLAAGFVADEPTA